MGGIEFFKFVREKPVNKQKIAQDKTAAAEKLKKSADEAKNWNVWCKYIDLYTKMKLSR